MIKMTVNQLLDPSFRAALGKLADSETLTFRAGYRMGKILDKIQPDMNYWEQKRQKVINAAILMDEEGKPVPVEGGEGYKLDPTLIPETNGKLLELFNTEIEMELVQVKMSDLQNQSGLTPNEIRILIPILEADLDLDLE
jgi:hypothetical protein